MADGRVSTVLGPVPAAELGPTTTHEHLLIDMTCYWRAPAEASRRALAAAPVAIDKRSTLKHDPLLLRDNCILDDLDLAIEELQEFRKLGGGTVVDVTLADIGRDPQALQAASRLTGVNVVMGCGHYVHLAHPPSLEEEPVESVAERLVRELTEGVDGTGVRPGVIGEIGTAKPLHPREEKVLRAAARAQAQTGVAITLHLDPPGRTGHDIMDILESEGASPERVVMGHLDATIDDSLEYHKSLAERGCFLQYDGTGSEMYFPGLAGGAGFWLPSDRARAKAVERLFDAGYGDRVLLAQDVCKKMDLTRYGGFGYAHILRSFVQNLRDFGLGRAEIDQVLIDNPRRMLTPAR